MDVDFDDDDDGCPIIELSYEDAGILRLEQSYRDLDCVTEYYDDNDDDNDNDNKGKIISSLILKWEFFREQDAQNAAAQLEADNLAPFHVVWNLSRLKSLELNEFQYHSIPDDTIGKLSRTLTDFTLRDCDNLIRISSEIGRLEKLTSLRIINCKRLERIPSEIGLLQCLSIFRIVDCKRLERIPSEIGQLQKNLKSLRIANCTRLDSLPPELWNLNGLEEFVLRGLTFPTFPSEIVRLEHLKVLSIFHNANLETLPLEIGLLPSLESLAIGHNENLQSLPFFFSIGTLKKKKKKTVTSLAIVDNPNLRTIPREIGTMENLKHLTIEACANLTALPSELCQLKKLESITLNRLHGLQTLPEGLVPSLTSLKYLTIRRCTGLTNLDNIFMSTAGLKRPRLRLLLITGCTKIDTIPMSLQTGVAPKRLNLSGMRRDAVVKFFAAPWAGSGGGDENNNAPNAINLDGAVRGVDGAGRLDNKDIPWDGPLVDPLEYDKLFLGGAYSSILPGLPPSLVELSLAEQGIEDLNGFIKQVEVLLPRGLKTLWLGGNPILKSTKAHDQQCLIKILQACPQLYRLCSSPKDQKIFTDAALAWLNFNKCGRILLSASSSSNANNTANNIANNKPIPLSVWSLVLEQVGTRMVNRQDPIIDWDMEADVVYMLLRGPALLERPDGFFVRRDPVAINGKKRKATTHVF